MVFLTLLSDAFHGLPSRRGVQPERYYYTTNKAFEQSLDIYRPVTNAARKQSSSPPPIVALVVGSAWLGHRSILYSGTSWWNSSGPKAVAELGYVCVCVSFVWHDVIDNFKIQLHMMCTFAFASIPHMLHIVLYCTTEKYYTLTDSPSGVIHEVALSFDTGLHYRHGCSTYGARSCFN